MALSAIYLDLDGVLVDFATGVARLVGTDPTPMYGPLNANWWGIMEVLADQTGRPWSEDDLLEMLEEAGHDFWVSLEKYPWCDELHGLCRSHAPTVIMTSPASNPSSASGKMQWIRDNLPDVDRFAITPCKHHLSHPGALLIDDSTLFCEEFRKRGGEAYLFPQPWSDPEGWRGRDPLAEVRELLERLSGS